MTNKDLTNNIIDEIYRKSSKKNYETNKKIYHIDEIWSIDLMDKSDYKVSNKSGLRYVFVIIDNFSKNIWCTPLRNKYGQTIGDECSNTLTTSKRKPNQIESDRGKELYSNIF